MGGTIILHEKGKGVICYRKILIKLKDKFYRATIYSTILYNSECWTVKEHHERKKGRSRKNEIVKMGM
ncbi:hypothetical protein CR513_22159, partial [Mucuna pruriens]